MLLLSPLSRQRRRLFEGIDAAMKTLKKRGAHPDVLRGRFPEESDVNAEHLPVLEQFLTEYRKRQAAMGKAQEGRGGPPPSGAASSEVIPIRMYLLKDGSDEPVECRTGLSLAWPVRRVREALTVLFDPTVSGTSAAFLAEEGAEGDGLGAPQPRISLLDHLKRHLKPAKDKQKERHAFETKIRLAEDALKNHHNMRITRECDVAVPNDDYVRMLGFLSTYCKANRHVRNSHVHIVAEGRPSIDYEDTLSKGVDSIGIVTLPAALLRADGEEDRLPNFGHWRYVLDRVDWKRLAASYQHKQKVLYDFWKGMDAACRNVAEKLGIHAVACDAVGPVLDGVLSKRRVEVARTAARFPTSAHDFVAAVARLAKAVAAREMPIATEGVNTVVKRHLKLLLRPDFTQQSPAAGGDGGGADPGAFGPASGDPAAAVLESSQELNAAALHTGQVLLRVRPGRDAIAAIPARAEKALTRFALRASLAAAQHQRIQGTVSRMAKATGIRVSADVAWLTAEGPLFLDRYERAVDELYRQRGRMMAFRLHGLELRIGDECLYDDTTGVLTLQWDADFDALMKLPVTFDAVGA